MREPISGAAAGFDPRRALPVRVELRRQVGRPSVRVLLALMVVAPVLVAVLLRAGGGQAVDGNIVAAVGTDSAANFTMLSLYGGVQIFLVIPAAHLFGESVARESAWSYLRVLLTVPVTRTQLVLNKIAAQSILLCGFVAVYGATSYVVGLVLFGHGPLTPISGTGTDGAAAVLRLLIMLAYVMVYLLWIAALAMLFSVLARDNPALATLGAIGATLASHAVGGLSSVRAVVDALPTHNFAAWLAAGRDTFDPSRMAWGLFTSVFYATFLVLLALVALNVRDVRR